MDISSVGAASIDMSIAKTMQSVGLAVTKEVMELSEVQSEALLNSLEQAVPSFGHKLDILA